MLAQDELLVSIVVTLYSAGFNGNFVLRTAENESSPPAPAPARGRGSGRGRGRARGRGSGRGRAPAPAPAPANIPLPRNVSDMHWKILTSPKWCGVLKYAQLPFDILVLLLERPEPYWLVDQYPDANWGVVYDALTNSGWNLCHGLPKKYVNEILTHLDNLITIQITPCDHLSWNQTLRDNDVLIGEFLFKLQAMTPQNVSDMCPRGDWLTLFGYFEKSSTLFPHMSESARREILHKLKELIGFQQQRNERAILNLDSSVNRICQHEGIISFLMVCDYEDLKLFFTSKDFLVNWGEVREEVESSFEVFSAEKELLEKLDRLCSMQEQA